VLGFSAALRWIEETDVVAVVLCNLGTMHSGEVPDGLRAVVITTRWVEATRGEATRGEPTRS
jgi:hypothetical protein